MPDKKLKAFRKLNGLFDLNYFHPKSYSMSIFKQMGCENVFKVTEQVLDVSTVKEEYDFINSHVSEAGAPLEIIDRKRRLITIGMLMTDNQQSS